jgi:hypothetical protein
MERRSGYGNVCASAVSGKRSHMSMKQHYSFILSGDIIKPDIGGTSATDRLQMKRIYHNLLAMGVPS